MFIYDVFKTNYLDYLFVLNFGKRCIKFSWFFVCISWKDISKMKLWWFFLVLKNLWILSIYQVWGTM
jgi:hypothetical protein